MPFQHQHKQRASCWRGEPSLHFFQLDVEGGRRGGDIPAARWEVGSKTLPALRPAPRRGGQQGLVASTPTHQHVYALHGGGVHPPGFKRPVCPKMALQSCLLGGKTRAEGLQQLFCAVVCLSQLIRWAPSLTLFLPSVPELHSSQIGDQNPIL